MLASEYPSFAQILLCLCMLCTDVYYLLAILSNGVVLIRTAQSSFVPFLCVRFLLKAYLKVLTKLHLVKGWSTF